MAGTESREERLKVMVIGDAGRRLELRLEARWQIALFSRVCHHGQAGVVEVACARRLPTGELRFRSRRQPGRYPAAGDTAALARLALQSAGRGEEVFCTPLPRRVAMPGKEAVDGGRVLWVDIDDPAAIGRLRAFGPRPHLVVASGSGGRHAYWRVSRWLPAGQLEAGLRALAHQLHADPQVCDRARIMRLPGTFHHKARQPCRALYADLHQPALAPERLLDGLADPDPPVPSAPRPRRPGLVGDVEDPAGHVPPTEYFRALAGVEVPASGFVRCPSRDHDDPGPSCRVYDTPARGWCCYGCGRAGSLADLASALQGGPTGRDLRGDAFKAALAFARERLGMPRPLPRGGANRRGMAPERAGAPQPAEFARPPQPQKKEGR